MSLANEILRTGFSPHSENNGFSRGDQTSSQHLVQDTITPYKICVFALVRLYLVRLKLNCDLFVLFKVKKNCVASD